MRLSSALIRVEIFTESPLQKPPRKGKKNYSAWGEYQQANWISKDDGNDWRNALNP